MTTTVDPAVQRRITTTIFTAQSLFSAAFIASFTLMPIVAARLFGADSVAGVPSTIILLGRAGMAYPTGWIMDKYGRRPGLVLGYLLATLGMVLAAFSIIWGSFLGFCVGAALLGMGRAGSEQTRYTVAEVYRPHRRAKIIGMIVFAGTVGAVLGPQIVPFATGIAENMGIDGQSGPYMLSAVLLALGTLVLFAFLRPDPLHISRLIAAENASEQVAQSQRPLSEIFAGNQVRLAVLAMVIGQLVMTVLMVITPLHMNHQNHSVTAISWVITSHTLGMFALSNVTGWLIDRTGRVTMILTGGLVLVSAGLLVPAVSTVAMLAFALFLLGLGWNFTFIAGSSLLADSLRPVEKGRAQGASEIFVALASGTGSFSTGFLFDFGGITAVAVLGLVLSLALVLFAVWVSRQNDAVVVEGIGD